MGPLCGEAELCAPNPKYHTHLVPSVAQIQLPKIIALRVLVTKQNIHLRVRQKKVILILVGRGGKKCNIIAILPYLLRIVREALTVAWVVVVGVRGRGSSYRNSTGAEQDGSTVHGMEQ